VDTWSDDGGSGQVGGLSYTATNIQSTRNVQVTFKLAASYTIGTSSQPPAGGAAVGGSIVGCGSNVTVSATPNACYQFVNWTEGGVVVSTSASYPFTASADRNLVANFSQISYSITTSSSPVVGGSTTGGGAVNCGSNATVTATASTGYSFVNWTENGVVVSTSASYTFTATASRDLEANFSTIPVQNWTITTGASPSAGGATGGGGSFANGSTVTVTATANDGYSFVNWTEGANVVSSSASYSFTASGNRTLVANFAVIINQPPVIDLLTVWNTLFTANGVAVALVDTPVFFAVEAHDPESQPLSYGWSFCDRATAGSSETAHSITNCGPCSVGVTVSDGQMLTISNLTVTVPCELNMTNKGAKAMAKLNFAKSNADSLTFKAFVDLGADFNAAGKALTLYFGGEVRTFTLDAKGKGVTYPNTCSLKYSRATGLWTFTSKWKSGSCADAWAAYGMTNETIITARPVTVPVVVLISTESFAAEAHVTYTAKGDKSGIAKY
jgi:hypothetical protein